MKKVLVIEDDVALGHVYEEMLEPGSMILAVNGEDGLAKAKTEKPALILLDIILPKLSGMQVLEKLKADPTTQHIPVIMLTNLNDPRQEEEAYKRGAIKYMVKSNFDPEDLNVIIQPYLINTTP